MRDPLYEELEFLRYFYDAVLPALGPAADEIVQAIKDEYVAEGNTLPKGYDPDVDE